MIGNEFYYNTRVLKKRWSNISPLEAAAKCGDFHLVNLMMEKVPIELLNEAITQLKTIKRGDSISQELGAYICGFVDLRQAYINYLRPLTRAELHNIQPDKDELNRLRGQLGDAWKNVSCFILQAFCNPISHKTTPNYKTEPSRDCMVFTDEGVFTTLDINSIGSSTFRALLKGDLIPFSRTSYLINLMLQVRSNYGSQIQTFRQRIQSKSY